MKLPQRCVTHCDAPSLPFYPSISGKSHSWKSDCHLEPTQIWSLPAVSLFSFPRSPPAGFFHPSRWEAFRVLPPAESLTNVALKCNEVWNGSCGNNYPRTGAVTALISLSLAIRSGYSRGRARHREMGDWVTANHLTESYERGEADSKQAMHSRTMLCSSRQNCHYILPMLVVSWHSYIRLNL